MTGAGFSFLIVFACVFVVSPARSALAEIKTPEAAPAKTRPAGTDADEPTTRPSESSELGRAISLIDTDPKKAARQLEALEDELPWVNDVIAYYAGVARGRDDVDDGREALEAFLENHQGSIVFADATAELARFVEADGDADRAIELAEKYGKAGSDSSSAASVCLSAGRLLAKKDPEKAYPYLQCARSKSPLSGAARKAYDLVTGLRAEHASLRPNDAQTLMAEARLLGRENRAPQQMAALRELLTKYPQSPVEGEAEIAYGRGISKTESKSAGAEFFEKRAATVSGPRRAKLLYEAGTLRWNDDRNDEARTLFETMLAMKTGSGDEQQALYALARISDVTGRRSDAIEYFGRAAALARGQVRADSEWRRGWVSYKAKDYAAARDSFAKMAAEAPRGSDTDGRPEALYWEGRSLERLGSKEEAHKRYTLVIAEFPSGYYAAAAERRLGRPMPTEGRATPLHPPENMPEPAALAIKRAKTLREAGLVTLANRDLTTRMASFDTASKRAVLPALTASAGYDTAFRVAIAMQEKGEISRAEARAYFYPRVYADIVEREADKAGIDPILVYALIRQESAFATNAVSSAKALGLMQLLETTARRVAAANGLPEPEPEDLFDPAVNIRLGVRYLQQLSKQFDGNTALMAAAYNAGENAAERWKSLIAQYDEDEMIEQISYRETRAYVKAILRNMRNYRGIYGAGTGPVAGAG